MRFTSETITDGVSERLFTLGDVPGVFWSPAGALAIPGRPSPGLPSPGLPSPGLHGPGLHGPGRPSPGRSLVLLAHGGGQHKKAPAMQGRARHLVTACGFAAAAIDAPASGDRPRTAEDERFIAEIRGRMAAGEPVGPQVARYNAAQAEQAVPEWRGGGGGGGVRAGA
jgi:hypothetical protein